MAKRKTPQPPRYVEAAELRDLARQARAAAGLTQAQAAERLGVRQATVSSAERDDSGRYAKLQCRMIGELGGGSCEGPLWRITPGGS